MSKEERSKEERGVPSVMNAGINVLLKDVLLKRKHRLRISQAWLPRRPSVTSKCVRRGPGEVQRDQESELIPENISPICHILAASPYHDQPQIAGPRIVRSSPI